MSLALLTFHKGQISEVNTFPSQQHNSTKISTENGENQEHPTDRIKQGNPGILTFKGNFNYSQIPSECGEHKGRQSLKTGKRIFKMEIEFPDISCKY